MGRLFYDEWLYTGTWSHGKPASGATFLIDQGLGKLGKTGSAWYYRGTLDDSLRLHGNVVTWHLSSTRLKFGDVDRAIVRPIGARSEGNWRHGVPIGTHVVRACDGCAIRRTAEFDDNGVFVDGDYPWSRGLLEEVEDEHQRDLEAGQRER